MSLCVSTIIASAGDLLDDTSIPVPTTTALRMLNDARRALSTETNCVIDTYTTYSVAHKFKYSLANNVIGIKKVTHWNGTAWVPLTRMGRDEWIKSDLTVESSDYGSYFYDDLNKQLYLYPRISAGTQSDTLSSGILATDLSIPVTDCSDFADHGRVTIGSEKLEFYYNSDTALTVNSTSERGVEGTTAASALSGATIYMNDIMVEYYKLPSDLTYGQNVEAVFEAHPKVLEYYICWQAKIKDTDDINPSGGLAQANYFKMLYEEEKARMMFTHNRVHDGPRTIREV